MAGKQIATDGCHLETTTEVGVTDLVEKFAAVMEKKNAGLKEKTAAMIEEVLKYAEEIAARMEEVLAEAEARNNEYDASKLEKLREDLTYLVKRLPKLAERKKEVAGLKDQAIARMVEKLKEAEAEAEAGNIKFDASKFEMLRLVYCTANMECTLERAIKKEGSRLQKLVEGLKAGEISRKLEHLAV